MLRVTLEQAISEEILNDLQKLMYKHEKLPTPKLVKDGNRYRYKFYFKTKHVEQFLRKLGTFKLEHNTLDVFSEDVKESPLNKMIYALNLKNLIFPIRVTIRYTLNDRIKNPQEFKSYLDSFFPEEEIHDPISLVDQYFNRFKIEFQIRDMEVFHGNFDRLKEVNTDVDMYAEFDKRTFKSYANFIAYVGAILFATYKGWDFVTWLLHIQSKAP